MCNGSHSWRLDVIAGSGIVATVFKVGVSLSRIGRGNKEFDVLGIGQFGREGMV
jgi:hypothetical protein